MENEHLATHGHYIKSFKFGRIQVIVRMIVQQTRSNSSFVSSPSEHQKVNELFCNDNSLLQTRRLTGDAARKGQCWSKLCKSHNSTQPLIRNDNSDEVYVSPSMNKDEYMKKCRAMQVPKQKEHRSKISNKVHIVTNKKIQYGHLISNYGQTSTDEICSPIVYRRSETVRNRVAPLWYHPFTVDA